MASMVLNNNNEKEVIKNKIIGFMEENDIVYNLIECCGCNRICLNFYSEDTTCKKYCCNSKIPVSTNSKELCIIVPHEILYIAIEDRKSVVYLTNRKLETNFSFRFWKNILDLKMFAQPHNSFLVNLSYVHEVTKEFVLLKHDNNIYQVYTSSRKIASFKKALFDYMTT